MNLSGIEVDDQQPVPVVRSAASRPAQKPRGGGILLTLILLLLAAAVAGLAYWALSLRQTLNEQQAALVQAQEQLAQMEQLLELTSDSASQAGQTLMGRIGQLETQASEKYEHFDSEIAKLWTIAYQRNKPQLEEQKKALAAQQKALDQLQERLTQGGKQIAALDARVDGLTALEQQLKKLDQGLNALEQKLAAQAQALDKASGEASFALSLEKDERVAADQALDTRIQQLTRQTGSAADLAGRVASIERSIQAIDGSRRQFNQSLLQLREQIAQLQRRIGG